MQDFKTLWKAYIPRLRIYSRNFKGLNNADREDCIQEIFLSIYSNLHTYNPRYAFSTWIYRIARNKLIDYQRSINSRAKKISPLDHQKQEISETPSIPWETNFDIAQAISTLNSEDQEIIFLYYLEDLSIKEIASITKRTVSAIKSKLFRIRKDLKTYLEEAYA